MLGVSAFGMYGSGFKNFFVLSMQKLQHDTRSKKLKKRRKLGSSICMYVCACRGLRGLGSKGLGVQGSGFIGFRA